MERRATAGELKLTSIELTANMVDRLGVSLRTPKLMIEIEIDRDR